MIIIVTFSAAIQQSPSSRLKNEQKANAFNATDGRHKKNTFHDSPGGRACVGVRGVGLWMEEAGEVRGWLASWRRPGGVSAASPPAASAWRAASPRGVTVTAFAGGEPAGRVEAGRRARCVL